MIRGVRRPDEVASLGLSNRLLVRVGALLKKNTAVSLTLLESAKPGSAVEQFLLAPIVLEKAGILDDDRLAAARESFSDPILKEVRAVTVEDGFQVLCLAEEIEAGDGWGAPAPAKAAQMTPVQQPLAVVSLPHASITLGSQGGGGPAQGGLFAGAELDRLKLRLLTAVNPAERIEALRTLLIAPLSPADKGDILLAGLADRDAAVRSEAARLLPVLGVDRDFADALNALNHSDKKQQQSAMERLQKRLAANPREVELGCTAACVLAMLKSESESERHGALLSLLIPCAPALLRDSVRVADVTRLVIQLLAVAAKGGVQSRELDAVLRSAYPLFTAFAKADAAGVASLLSAELERASDSQAEGFLLQILLDITPNDGAAGHRDLLNRAVSYIGREKNEGRDSRSVGTRLVSIGAAAIEPLCEGFDAAHPGAQKYILLLLENISRMQTLSAEQREAAAKLLAYAMGSGNKGVRMAAMECRFAAHEDVSEETRGKIVRLMLAHMNDFTFRTEIENVEAILARMGLSAAAPLVERLAPERQPADRIRAVRLLGDWSLSVRAPKGQLPRLQETVTDVLRRLEMLNTETSFPGRGELFSALGKLTACPAVTRDTDAIIIRTLLEHAQGRDAKLTPRALEGLCYIASARRAQPEFIQMVAGLLKGVLEQNVPDLETSQKQINGDMVIEITGGEAYTSALPIVLNGIGRIASSPTCPTPVVRDLATLLAAKLKLAHAGKLIWGPGNTLLLINTLKTIALQKSIFSDLRMEIVRVLATKYFQMPNLAALTEILAADDTGYSAASALTIGYGILDLRHKDGAFPMDDREEILRGLARLAGRKHLGTQHVDSQQKAAAFRRVVAEELLRAVKDRVPGSFEALSQLKSSDKIPDDARRFIESEMNSFGAR